MHHLRGAPVHHLGRHGGHVGARWVEGKALHVRGRHSGGALQGYHARPGTQEPPRGQTSWGSTPLIPYNKQVARL